MIIIHELAFLYLITHSFLFSTIFKHWSENSVNRGSCMAAFIASYLLSALSMDSNNCLRCGLQSRSLSSFDWPVIKKKKTFNFYFFSHGKRKEGKNKLLPKSWSLCRGTLSVMSPSSKRSSTVHGSVKTVIQIYYVILEKKYWKENTNYTFKVNIYKYSMFYVLILPSPLFTVAAFIFKELSIHCGQNA